MPWIRDRYRELRALLHGERPERDVAEEFEHHLAMRTEENLAAGMSPAEARAAALARFGDLAALRAETRRIDEAALRRRRLRERVNELGTELRRAMRSLARTPAFTVAAFLALALGLGATTSIFALLNAVVLHPLPYDHADELVKVMHPVPGIKADTKWGVSSAGFFFFRRGSKTLADVGAFSRYDPIVESDGRAELLVGAAVSTSLFKTLRFRPQIGRLFTDADDSPGAPSTLVLGHGYWMRRFGGDSTVLGKQLLVEGQRIPIIGVLATGEDLPDQHAEVWVPMQLNPAGPFYNSHNLHLIARRAPSVSIAATQAELAQLVAAGLPDAYPTVYTPSFMKGSQFGVEVTSLKSDVLEGLDRVLWTLLGSVLLVLVVACANVANLFLVRADSRQREAAIRIALGAGRARLLRQLLVESLLVTLVAGAAGVGIAMAAVRIVVARAPEGLPRLGEIALLPTTYVVAFALSAAAGVVFALIQSGRSAGALTSLREGGRGLTLTRRQHAVRGALVVGQMALAMMLLAAAGLMVQSFRNLSAVSPGYDSDSALAFDVALPGARYRSYETVEAFDHLLADRLAALPGVTDVGAATMIPLDDPGGCSLVFAEGTDYAKQRAPCVPTPAVAPGYFRTLRIPLRGTEPGWTDVEHKVGGVVVTKALADRLWPGEDPVGKGIKSNGNSTQPPYYRVVAVSGDLRDEGLDKPPLQAVFYPLMPMEGTMLWGPANGLHYVVRYAKTDIAQLVPAARRTIAELDAGVALARPRTLGSIVERAGVRVAFAMLLLVAAAAMALVLSAVGIYGVITYLVGQRQVEIGIRIALGAPLGEVVRMVAMQSVRFAVLGVGIGLVGAVLANRLLRTLLYEVSPTDPFTLGLVSLVLVAVAAGAGWLPARRAARISPVEAMR
jgi:predicted permease